MHTSDCQLVANCHAKLKEEAWFLKSKVEIIKTAGHTVNILDHYIMIMIHYFCIYLLSNVRMSLKENLLLLPLRSSISPW